MALDIQFLTLNIELVSEVGEGADLCQNKAKCPPIAWSPYLPSIASSQ
jgi:hypothetical protein